MPVAYAGTVSEHNATREAVGLFDVSHLGKALITGPGAAEFVNSALTNDLRRIGPGKAQYTLCCTGTGGGDRRSDRLLRLRRRGVPGSQRRQHRRRGRRHESRCPRGSYDRRAPFAVLAVQGPRSTEVLAALGLLTDMDYMGYEDAEYSGVPAGYAGPATPANTATNLAAVGSAAVVFDALVEQVRGRR
jgi:aminomethyltransferase